MSTSNLLLERAKPFIQNAIRNTMIVIESGLLLLIYSITATLTILLVGIFLQQPTVDLIISVAEFIIGQPILAIVVVLAISIQRKVQFVSTATSLSDRDLSWLLDLLLSPAFVYVGVRGLIRFSEMTLDSPGGSGGVANFLASIFLWTGIIGFMTILSGLIVNGSSRAVLTVIRARDAIPKLYQICVNWYRILVIENVLVQILLDVNKYSRENNVRYPFAIILIFLDGLSKFRQENEKDSDGKSTSDS